MPTVHEIVTDRIIEMLEQGAAPWRKPWNIEAPRNLVSKKAYRGINVMLLQARGFASPYWLTYRQALELGGNVRKGEKSTLVVFWKWRERVADPEDAERAETERPASAPILRYYNVFNVEQCDGIKAPAVSEIPANTDAESIIANMPKRPPIQNGEAAFYSPAMDYVQIPPRGSFDSGESFYNILFHELTHSTGHSSRLNRFENEKALAPFGSTDYSKEELTAEIGAAMLCATAGIESRLPQSSAYIANWLHVLKNDKRMVVFAAARAQKAVDFILNQKPAEGGSHEANEASN